MMSTEMMPKVKSVRKIIKMHAFGEWVLSSPRARAEEQPEALNAMLLSHVQVAASVKIVPKKPVNNIRKLWKCRSTRKDRKDRMPLIARIA